MPEAHVGRLLDHVGLRVTEMEATKRFYAAVLAALGHELQERGPYLFFDELYFSDDGPATTGLHIAFQADDPDAVDAFHAAALQAGGRDNGAPGEREYHPGYYAAYVLDPDGNNVEAVYHGPGERSAPSVVVTWEE
jgi:catechol 2,3-dioxygenase-like lactoylglutathione lyase family enzyme